MNRLLDAALDYAHKGWPVLPLHSWTGRACTCGKENCVSPAKHPRTVNGLKNASTLTETLRSWWGRWNDANIGLLTGVAFDVLDVDGDLGLAAIAAMEHEHGATPMGPTSFTGGGGIHRLFETSGSKNRAGMLDHVDWRGGGGYIVAPPSVHATGNHYEWAQEGPDTPLPKISGWLHQLLFPPQRRHDPGAPRAGASVGNYGRRAFDAEIGELIRAGEGTRNHTLNAVAFNLYQLVSGGELDDQEVTDALTSAARGIGLAEREIDGTISSARAAGISQPRSAPVFTVVGNNALAAERRPQTAVEHPEPPEPTGWERLDLTAYLDGTADLDTPGLYPRSDDQLLLYIGKVHSFNGEPESGKSWCALDAAAWAITGGYNVTYLDFEDNPASITARMLALGATPSDILTRFNYHRVDQPYSLEASLVLDDALSIANPMLTVLDGITEAMSLCGLDPYGNTDVAKFWGILPRRLARTGAAVVLIDHVVKSREDRGRWAIGAQHKMAAIDGAAFNFETTTPFGRNRHGVAKVTISKDRPGWLRQHATAGVIGEFHLKSEEGRLSAWVQQPAEAAEDGGMRPTHLMDRVSRYVALHPKCPKADVERDVTGNAKYLRRAVEVLISEGFLELNVVERKHLLIPISDFREDIEETT